MTRTASELVGVNKNISSYYFHRLREIIYHHQEENTMFSGEIEVDESYFGGVRKGRRHDVVDIDKQSPLAPEWVFSYAELRE